MERNGVCCVPSKALRFVPDAGSGSIDSLFVKTDYRLLRIGLDDILYVEGLKDYVRIRFWKSSFLRTDSYGCTVRISSSLRRCRISREEGSYSAR